MKLIGRKTVKTGKVSAPKVKTASMAAGRASASTSEPTHDDIAARAYELYLSRGGVDGDDVSDWLAAERLVRSNASRSDGRNG